MSASNRDAFFDDNDTSSTQQPEEPSAPPTPAARRRLSNEVNTAEVTEDPVIVPPQSPSASPRPDQAPTKWPETIPEEAEGEGESKAPSRASPSSSSISFEPAEDDEDEKQQQPELACTVVPSRSTVDADAQTDQVSIRDESVQTEATDTTPTSTEVLGRTTKPKITFTWEYSDADVPLVKTLLDQPMLCALPIISFCHPFSMTSRVNDVILAMPRHIMIVHNQNSISVYPWRQPHESTSTILDCFWCPFLYKLLVATVEENQLFIYDFVSIIDTIKLRGYPLSVKHQSHSSHQTTSTSLLPPSARHQPLPAVWSQTRFTKSNSLGIYYCYISDRHNSCMLSRIDHNTRQHVRAIDCSGGSLSNNARICAMGLSDDRVAVVLTNLIMTLYHAETLAGLRQINLARWNAYGLSSVSALVYLWKTWVVFDSIESKVVGVAKRKRQFVRMLPDRPINACPMENGTLALWIGYPGALVFYRLRE